jgi:hypothetical protein
MMEPRPAFAEHCARHFQSIRAPSVSVPGCVQTTKNRDSDREILTWLWTARSAPPGSRRRTDLPHPTPHANDELLTLPEVADPCASPSPLSATGGRASATVTLDTYGHLFEDRLNEFAMRRTAPAQPPDSAATIWKRRPVLPEWCPSPIANEIPKGPLPASLLVRTPLDLYPRRDSNPRYRLERPIEG